MSLDRAIYSCVTCLPGATLRRTGRSYWTRPRGRYPVSSPTGGSDE